jgi:tetratricopeptide (TPR) repeat protein
VRRTIVSLLLLIAAGKAQELQVLKVELKFTGGALPACQLELYDMRNHIRVDSAQQDGDGSFTLRRVPYGDYQLIVADGAGDPVHQEFITISGITAPITITLRGIDRPQRPGGPVSLSQLQHPPAKKAFQAMQAAQRFSQSGDHEKAEVELQKAVRISPYFADALTNLAVQHIYMKRYGEAQAELSRALEIAGPNPLILTNLAATECALDRATEAIRYARAALQLEPDYPQARYILKVAQSMQ